MGLSYEVRYHPLVVRHDLTKISSRQKRRIKEAIERKLMTEPEIFGVPLRQSLKGFRKLRVGDYRVVFKINRRTIFVLAILHRSVVYRTARRRRQ